MKVYRKVFFVFIVFCISVSNLFAIIPDTTYIRTPEYLGLIYKDLDIVTKDNYKIKTWFFPAQNPISDEEFSQLNGAKREYSVLDENPRPTIIICTGDAGNMSYYQLIAALNYTLEGYNVVTFDWRGFGHSSPFEMDKNYLCYTEMLEDYRAVVDYVAEMPEVKGKPISLLGWSTGAYLSMITAYENKNVSAFIGRAITTNFDDVIPILMKVRNKTKENLLVPDDFPIDKMPINLAPKFNKPIFLIVGDQDDRTPVWMSEKIIKNLPETTKNEIWIVEGATHGGEKAPEIIAFDEFFERTLNFLNENVGK